MSAATEPAAPAVRPRKGESAVGKFLVSGGVTWVYELFLGHFLEFLKGSLCLSIRDVIASVERFYVERKFC